MSDSLSPWILEYLTTIAETHGAQLSNIPLHARKKRVQITEFLTYGSDIQDTYVWARVSDKQYSVPIKFSKEAIEAYKSLNMNALRFTQHKGAITTIRNFRPIFSRLPLGDGGKPTTNSHLALECNEVFVLGASGECTFGNPRPISSNPDMLLWSNGLNQAGGAGNVLKDQKAEREANHALAESTKRRSMPPPPAPISPPAPLPSAKSTAKSKQFWITKTNVADIGSYKTRWQMVEKNTHYRHPPGDVEMSDAALEVPIQRPTSPQSRALSRYEKDVESPSTPKGQSFYQYKSRSATPLTVWEQSPEVSKKVSSSIDDSNLTYSSRIVSTVASSMNGPTPAQRIRRPTITPSDHLPSSSPLGNETAFDTEPPSGSHSQADVLQVRLAVPRKIPRPTSPESPHHTGPERILVPNSDTSGTQSQSQSIGQSQSQSRPDHQEKNFAGAADQSEGRDEQNAENENKEDEHAVAMEDDNGDEELHEAPRGSEVAFTKFGPIPTHAQRRASEKRDSAGKADDGRGRGFAERGNGEKGRLEAGPAADMIMSGGSYGSEKPTQAWRDEEGEQWPWMNLEEIRRVIAKTRDARSILRNQMIS